jgi:chromosome segregation ATPase
MFKSQEIADLQGKITKLEADLKTAGDNAATIQAELDQAKIDLATAQAEAGKVAGLNTQIGTLNSQITTLTTRAENAEKALVTAQADFEIKVNAEVTTRLAAAGVDPIKRDPQAKTDDTGKPKIDASAPPRQRATAAMENSFKVFGKN